MFRWSYLWILIGVLGGFIGCSQEAAKKKPADGVEVNWPGGSFKYDEEKGVQVKTQDVDVDVNKDSGVKVKTPNTEIKADPQKGIDIQTPKSDVQVK